jgi:serine/threonine-protein kinase
MALLLKHVSEKPQPIAELRPEAPRQLCDAIERALRKAPEERWATASAFRDALMGADELSPSWRVENRDPLRYNSPVPRSRREPSPVPKSKSVRGNATAPATTSPSPVIGEFELEPPYLASLTTEQRADLRLWQGRINLLDRVKSFRRYTVATHLAWIFGAVCFGFGVAEVPPLVAGAIVPFVMTRTWWRRGKSLRERGLRIRRVLLARRSRGVLLGTSAPTSRALRKLAPRPVLESPRGAVIRKAAEEKAAILGIVASLSKADRAMLPDVIPTVNALVERVAKMATRLHELDASYDPDAIAMLDARIADSESSPDTTDALRQLTLLRRQRVSIQHAARERSALARRLDNAGLALANLRLDLAKLKSSGLESVLSDVTSATQEARALSRDIGSALDAVAEVRAI